MNWSLISYGAYDFAAEPRCYTSDTSDTSDASDASVEYVDADWGLRAGRFN